MKCLYITSTGEKLNLDGYKGVNIKFGCQERKGAITSAVQEMRNVKTSFIVITGNIALGRIKHV
jgi:hypothetical protein